jgi:hypothetical protein
MPLQDIIYSQTPGFIDPTLIITDVVPRSVSLLFSDIENELYDHYILTSVFFVIGESTAITMEKGKYVNIIRWENKHLSKKVISEAIDRYGNNNKITSKSK